jgi:probable HAF family extracellular repeat protein
MFVPTRLALLALLSLTTNQVGAQQAYELMDLGTLGGTTAIAYDINTSGQVVGGSTTSGDAATHAFLYSQGTMTDLGTLGGANSTAFGINDSGQTVGYSNTSAAANHATLWTGTTATDLGTAGTTESYAYGINNGGQVVGSIGAGLVPCTPTDTQDYLYGFGCGVSATLWSAGIAINLGALDGAVESAAISINDAGQAVGYVVGPSSGDGYKPALWTSTTITLLPIKGAQGNAFGINAQANVVGQVTFVAPSFQGSLWNGDTNIQLTSACGCYPVGAALSINSAQQMVGVDSAGTPLVPTAVLWPSAAVEINLNATLRPTVAAANFLTEARAINASGQIVANGTVTATGATHAYLLTPVTAAGAPTATLSANPTTVQTGHTFVLTWSSTNAWACSAGGTGVIGAPWTGTLATSGTQTINAGSTAGTITATLSCSFGNAQSAPAQAVVSVTNPPPPSKSGGGAFDLWTLIWLFGVGARRPLGRLLHRHLQRPRHRHQLLVSVAS